MTKEKYTQKDYKEAGWKNINKVLYRTLRASFKFNRTKEYLYRLLETRLKISIEKDCKNHAWKRKLEKGDYNFSRDEMLEELIRKNFHQIKSTFFANPDNDPLENMYNRKIKWDDALGNAHEYSKDKENYWEEFTKYLSNNYSIGFLRGKYSD